MFMNGVDTIQTRQGEYKQTLGPERLPPHGGRVVTRFASSKLCTKASVHMGAEGDYHGKD